VFSFPVLPGTGNALAPWWERFLSLHFDPRTGGIAGESVNDWFNVNFMAPSFITASPHGVAYGGGIEYAFGPSLSLKAEYQHLHFAGFTMPPAPVIRPNGITVFNGYLRSGV
jgi:opacity protein-like surface antigen